MTPLWTDNIPEINNPKSNSTKDEIDIQISEIEKNLENTKEFTKIVQVLF